MNKRGVPMDDLLVGAYKEQRQFHIVQSTSRSLGTYWPVDQKEYNAQHSHGRKREQIEKLFLVATPPLLPIYAIMI